MKTLVVYDSVYGNTEKIAQAIADAITGEVKVLRVGELNTTEFGTFDLLIVGSPTHGGRPTEATRDFLDLVQDRGLKGANVAAFDTRLAGRWVGIIGFAAKKIAGSLKKGGGTLVVAPEGFFVEGSEGPLREGELQRAAGWAKEIVKSIK